MTGALVATLWRAGRATASRRAARQRRGHERGSSTLFASACLATLLLLGAALGVVSAIVVDHRRAQSAADLAALAGAGAVARGADACEAAGRLASRNGAALASCTVQGHDVLVTVVVTGPRWLGQTGDLTAGARAGPG